MKNLPLNLGRFDHYTLIVPNAEECTRFHIEVLGFEWVRKHLVNAGSAPEGKYDMLNHLLHLPGDKSRTLVITEGLTDNSIFRKYLSTYGAGIHHVAYEVDNLEASFTILQNANIPLTSKNIIHDPLSGLQQVFISKESTGYFIELIERSPSTGKGVFKEKNIVQLANTMNSYLDNNKAGNLHPNNIE